MAVVAAVTAAVAATVAVAVVPLTRNRLAPLRPRLRPARVRAPASARVRGSASSRVGGSASAARCWMPRRRRRAAATASTVRATTGLTATAATPAAARHGAVVVTCGQVLRPQRTKERTENERSPTSLHHSLLVAPVFSASTVPDRHPTLSPPTH